MIESACVAAFDRRIETYDDLDTETFDEYLVRKSKVYFLTKIHQNLREDGHLDYACTCPSFLHYALCKHVLAVAMYRDEKATRALFNPDWEVTQIGVRAGPGRPKKNPKGLVKN